MFTCSGEKLIYVVIDQKMNKFIEVKESHPIALSSKFFFEMLVSGQLARTEGPIDYLYKIAGRGPENRFLSAVRAAVIVKHEAAKSNHLMICDPLEKIFSFIFE